MSAGGGSLAASQGMRAATAQLAEEAALRNHPETMKQVADDEMSGAQKREWIRSIDPTLSEDQVNATVKALYNYSKDPEHYRAMHDGNPDNDPEIAKEIKLVDHLFTHRNAPVYKGDIFRGLRWKNSEQELRDIIKAGTWTEKGITSFSTEKYVSEGFAGVYSHAGTSEISVVLRVPAGKNMSAVPFQHLSHFGNSESEVLTPSTVKDRGWSIKSAKWHVDKSGHKTVTIDMEENTRRRK